MKTLAIIENDPITVDITPDGRQVVRFRARGRIDDDGRGPGHGDPYHQGQTTLRQNGESLDADIDSYIVVPPQVVQGVPGIVMGSQAYVTYRGLRLPAVTGDGGPRGRLGEISRALAEKLAINADPNIGGDDLDDIDYEIEVGIAAVVDGVEYGLQAA